MVLTPMSTAGVRDRFRNAVGREGVHVQREIEIWISDVDQNISRRNRAFCDEVDLRAKATRGVFPSEKRLDGVSP
jgi:hypothetical protein